jgi:peptidoglycan/LPS O-acetylase OafA/YrhL
MSNNSLTTKPHYPILDGLRGVAAILVVLFHIVESHFHDFAFHPIHHGYLAVDFFFLLSGFVVGYAYDDRWEYMSLWTFIKIRLIRLHPMVVLSVIIGAICFWFDPYTGGRDKLSFLQLIGVMLMSFTLLPSPDFRGWNETHFLVGPSWSLFQEYIANIIYGVFGQKMSKIVLGVLVFISAAVLTAVVTERGNIATGWGYDTFWIALVRMMFPFFAGLLLFRLGYVIKVPAAFTISSIALIVLFCLPYFRYNGLYEAACIIIAFPIIVAMGVGGKIEGRTAKLSDFFADISYPLYITHYPFIYIYDAWIGKEKPTSEQFLPVAIGLFFLMMVVAFGSLKLYDVPVRQWLTSKILLK